MSYIHTNGAHWVELLNEIGVDVSNVGNHGTPKAMPEIDAGDGDPTARTNDSRAHRMSHTG